MRTKDFFLSLSLICLFLLAGFGLLVNPGLIWAQNECEHIECDSEDQDEADYLDCIQEKKTCLEEKIDQTRQAADTLTNAISVLNGEINLQQWQINQTLAEINQLEKEILELDERIDGLSLSLDRLSSMLIERIQTSYKQGQATSLLAIFTSQSFNDFITQLRYLKQAKQQIADAMHQAENQRVLYDQQKSLKEIKQEKLELKQQELQQQQQALQVKKADKQRILTETKNDEVTYQRLLAQAKRQIAALKSYASKQVGGETCLAGPAEQPDGWYWSQRDARWCKQTIGNSLEIMGEVGCLIASTAMIWQKHGAEMSPSTLASNASYFSLNTAYMKNPLPAPPGYTYRRYDYRDFDLIDQELEKDRPVIVHLSIGGDGHFVVLKEGQDGDYQMNDPLFGADMAFTDKYQTYMIDSIRTFTPS